MLSGRIFATCFPFKCDSCEKRFRTSLILQQHVVTAHFVMAKPEEEEMQSGVPQQLVQNPVKTEGLKQEPTGDPHVLPLGTRGVAGGRNVASTSSCFCATCGEVFASERLFREHERYSHNRTTDSRWRLSYDGVQKSGSESPEGLAVDSDPAGVKVEVKQEPDSDGEGVEVVRSTGTHLPPPKLEPGLLAGAVAEQASCAICGETFPTWLLYYKHRVERHPGANPRVAGSRVPESLVEHAPTVSQDVSTATHEPRTTELACGLKIDPLKQEEEEEDADGSDAPGDPSQSQNESITKRELIKIENYDTLNSSCPDGGSQEQTAVRLGSFDCEDCGKQFTDRQSLAKHAIAHLGDYIYVCVFCHARFRTEYALRHHGQERHDDMFPFKCRKCPEKFDTGHQLLVHRQEKHDPARFQCDLCLHRFKRYTGLQTHKRLFHNGTGKQPMCLKCGKRFSFVHLLRQHYNTVHQRTLIAEPVSARKERLSSRRRRFITTM